MPELVSDCVGPSVARQVTTPQKGQSLRAAGELTPMRLPILCGAPSNPIVSLRASDPKILDSVSSTPSCPIRAGFVSVVRGRGILNF